MIGYIVICPLVVTSACGGLYAMAFMPTLNVRMLVPVGGIAFLLGWTMLLSAACLGDRYAR